MSEQPGIPMCPKCLQEKRKDIGTLSSTAIEGMVNCQFHGNYRAEEMWVLRGLGFIGQWVIAPGQCASQDSDADHPTQTPPVPDSERI